ncbi:MAG TPA: dihydrofolate reductase family protein [Dehalococcoidia bacterium]|nr:dihydrofolate reductase family protein [Dehalococcoidia bacterium]
MRKLIESTFVSLDGVIDDTSPSTFKRAEPQIWGAPYWDEEHGNYGQKLTYASDAMLLGRATYDGFKQAWPGRTGEFADFFNAMPKYVASRTLSGPLEWNATAINGDIAKDVASLKEQPGKGIIKYGTGELDQPLLAHRLVDEYHFWVFPVVIGGGKRLLDGLDTTHLQLIDSTRFASGITVLVLAPK